VADHGVDPARIVPVVNLAPKAPHRRAELTATIARLTHSPAMSDGPAPVLFVPHHKKVEQSVRDALPLPRSIVQSVAAPIQVLLDAASVSPVLDPGPGSGPERVVPGSLGSWALDGDVAG
jgi:hypothetical protein